MGGKSETKISSLRMHISNNNVHVHDDSKNLKFETSTDNFKEDVNSAFEDLKKGEGVVKIVGHKGDDMYIMRDGRNFKIFLMGKNSSIKQELQSFLRNC